MLGPIDWNRAFEMIIIILVAIDIHELAHAVVADRLGDPTPRRNGQISLNPLVHMDQVGIILLILTALSQFGFTYGRTFVTPSNLRYGPQRGGAIVAIAGPISNIILAAICGLALWASVNGHLNSIYSAQSYFSSFDIENFIYLAMQLNILLFLLNLIPIPPLDGFTVLGGFLSARQMYSLAPLQQWGPLIILLIFVTDGSTHIVGDVLTPAIDQISRVFCPGCFNSV